MGQADEAAGARTPLGADLAAGIDSISMSQVVKFTKYIRLVLPLDGYVFWVRADLVGPSAIFGESNLDEVPIDAGPAFTPASTIEAPGSLHYGTVDQQGADSAYSVDRVVFTSKVPINDFEDVGPNELFIGEFEGLKFAFSARKSFYAQSNTYHYVGDAVYPIMASQLVDSVEGFDSRQIVSNSLPIWLSLNGVTAAPWQLFGNATLILYPAFLSGANLETQFGTVEVIPESTQALASAPTLGPSASHDQLVRERVKITLWGLRNEDAMNFVDFVNQYSVDYDVLGIMNVPTIRDEHQTQVELGTLAQKKVIEYEVSYYQSSARDAARQLLLRAIPTFIFP